MVPLYRWVSTELIYLPPVPLCSGTGRDQVFYGCGFVCFLFLFLSFFIRLLFFFPLRPFFPLLYPGTYFFHHNFTLLTNLLPRPFFHIILPPRFFFLQYYSRDFFSYLFFSSDFFFLLDLTFLCYFLKHLQHLWCYDFSLPFFFLVFSNFIFLLRFHKYFLA